MRHFAFPKALALLLWLCLGSVAAQAQLGDDRASQPQAVAAAAGAPADLASGGDGLAVVERLVVETDAIASFAAAPVAWPVLLPPDPAAPFRLQARGPPRR